nr:hypothetical protein [uncultured Neisseria sp.]
MKAGILIPSISSLEFARRGRSNASNTDVADNTRELLSSTATSSSIFPIFSLPLCVALGSPAFAFFASTILADIAFLSSGVSFAILAFPPMARPVSFFVVIWKSF